MTTIEFKTINGITVKILPISISLNQYADITALAFHHGGIHHMKFTMDGNDYKNWGNDDDYIKHYICSKELFLGEPEPTVDASGNPITYKPIITQTMTMPVIQDDAKSVHNDADIQRIQTLQEQLDAQATKLKTITDMLIGKGLV